MQLLKARKNAKISAVGSIIVGLMAVSTAILFYFRFIRHFEVDFAHITKDERAQAIILSLVAGSKTLVTCILSACGVMLLITGFSTLHYLKKEREEKERKSG